MPRKFLNGVVPTPALPLPGGGTGATTAAGALANLGLNSVAAVSCRNRLINGNLSLNQRGASSASTSYSSGTYIMDRWKAGSNGCTLSFSTAANGDVTVTVTAGTLVQVIEGTRYISEGGAYVLSWQGTATARIYQGTASGSYVASPAVIAGLTAGTNTTIEFGTGTLGLVQFEPGSISTVFERRDDELYRSQRYFLSMYLSARFYASGSGQYLDTHVSYPVNMRAVPTVTLATAGTRSSNLSSVTVNAQFTSARLEIVSSGTGDCYALFDVWTFSSEL